MAGEGIDDHSLIGVKQEENPIGWFPFKTNLHNSRPSWCIPTGSCPYLDLQQRVVDSNDVTDTLEGELQLPVSPKFDSRCCLCIQSMVSLVCGQWSVSTYD